MVVHRAVRADALQRVDLAGHDRAVGLHEEITVRPGARAVGIVEDDENRGDRRIGVADDVGPDIGRGIVLEVGIDRHDTCSISRVALRGRIGGADGATLGAGGRRHLG